MTEDPRFCHVCGAAITATVKPAEYKQVTVLFADVVHSMDIAAAVGAERLREIMSGVLHRCAGVVQRYGPHAYPLHPRDHQSWGPFLPAR
jgi:adenylate cyclase